MSTKSSATPINYDDDVIGDFLRSIWGASTSNDDITNSECADNDDSEFDEVKSGYDYSVSDNGDLYSTTDSIAATERDVDPDEGLTEFSPSLFAGERAHWMPPERCMTVTKALVSMAYPGEGSFLPTSEATGSAHREKVRPSSLHDKIGIPIPLFSGIQPHAPSRCSGSPRIFH